MAQIELLRTGKWANQLASPEEMAEKVAEVRGYVNKYGWLNRSVHPYGFAIGMDKFLAGFEDYEHYTHSSKQIMIAEMNGFIKIANVWIKQEEEPKVAVRLLTGKHKGEIEEIPESFVEDYVEIGLAEVIG